MREAAPAVRERIEIRPQEKQEQFLRSTADIAIYGGARGGGKSFALLLEPLYHVANPNFGAVIFRRTRPQLTMTGGLWEESFRLYPHLGAVPRETMLDWKFPSGATVRFAHLEHERDLENWLGAQIPLLCFDQLEAFTEREFWFLLGSNRSTSGVRPYVRATCNPDPDSWLAGFLEWWIGEDGYPVDERAGATRYLSRVDDDLKWSHSNGEAGQKSVTFVPATLEDNPILREKDPGYEAKLEMLPRVERERFRRGNWKVRPTAGTIFNEEDFKIIGAAPTDIIGRVRYWDKAGTEDGGKYTAGVLIAQRANGRFVVENVVRGQWSALKREQIMRSTAELDARLTPAPEIWLEQEPGSGGKESAEGSVRNLAGFVVQTERPTGAKTVRARPFAVQVQAGNVDVVAADWTVEYLKEHHAFDQRADNGGLVCDQVDASSGAFNKVALGPTYDIDVLNG